MISTKEMPECWKVKTINEVCEYIQRGKQPEYDDENGRIKIINQRCIYWDGLRLQNTRKLNQDNEGSWKEYRYLQQGDVLVNSTGEGTLGRAQIWDVETDEDYIVDGHVTILRSDESVIPEYLFRFLQSPIGQQQIESYTKGSTGQTELYKKHINEIKVPVPPLEEQERIVKHITERLGRVERLERSVQTVRQLSSEYEDSIITYTFTDKNYHAETDIKTIPSEQNIPDNWNLANFGDVIESSFYGCNPQTGEDLDGVSYLRITDISEKRGLKYRNLPEKAVFENSDDKKKYELQEGDLVIARSGASSGQSYIYDSQHGDMVYASYLIRFRLNTDLISKEYARIFLNSPAYWSQVESAKKGSAQNNINAGSIKEFKIPLPPLAEQDRLVREMEQIDFTRIEKSSELLGSLFDEYRNSVLAHAFQ